MRSKCPVYVINPSVMRELNLKATTGSDPGIPYTAMSLCATAKEFASPRTVFVAVEVRNQRLRNAIVHENGAVKFVIYTTAMS